MEALQRLRTARSETNLRRKPVSPTPPLPSQPPPPYSSSKPYDNDVGLGLGIQTSIVPVNRYDGDHTPVTSQRPLMPLPLRIPGRRAPSPAPETPQTTTQVRHEVHVETQTHAHVQMRAETVSPEEVPGLTPSIRAKPGAFMSRSRPTSPSPVSLSPATPDSASGVFPPTETGEAVAAPAKKNFFKNAADETAFFAGGLISHPAESTKHYTILRHSGGIVMYKGSETSVTISIFSSEPLPTDRTLWLQQRGFSGDKGMKLKTLVGATGSWINVTPVSRVDVSAVPEGDERAFQRDSAKWLKKAAKAGGKVSKHVWRETHVVRIPAAAEDGYFRIILCASSSSSSSDHYAQGTSPYYDDGTVRPPPKKKTLCCSPVFRVLSTSKDVSVLRGASVTTMPLEMGIKVASTVGIVYASKYTKPVTMAAGAAQGRAATMVTKKIKHSETIAKVGMKAYDKSGMQGRLVEANNRYNTEHAAGRYNTIGQRPAVFGENTVGPDEGPEQPFPIKFGGKVVRGTGRGASELSMPTANLDDVPEEMRQRLRGVYFGWACVQPNGSKKAQPLDEAIDPDWHEAIITVGVPTHSLNPAVITQRPIVTVHLVNDFGPGVTFFDARMKLVVMGYLRPTLTGNGAVAPPSMEQHLHCLAMDRMLTLGSLAREAWAPEVAKDQIRELKNARTFSDRLVGARDKAQMQFDRVPVHLLASQELTAEFNKLLSSPTNFALLATISSESLKPVTLLTSSPSSSFDDNLNGLLAPHLKPNEALYILLRRHDAAPHLVAITYIPDLAPVRQKMLFASTRLTLVRELGSEHFRDTVFANSAEELTPQGFKKQDAHSDMAAPLTEEERTLGAVKRAEQEAGAGTGVREIHLSKNLNMPIDNAALQALKELADENGSRSLVMMKINPETETVENVATSATPSTISELVSEISATEPRFTFYRYTHQHGGETQRPVLFFYTCPTSTTGRVAIKFRMLYPLMKRAVLTAAEKETGVVAEKKFEVEETSEITEESVLSELHPQVEQKKAFSRPKRPGR
ncbi:hypothetical protein PspLS_09705 [Pyricularia sp. CBS 133598]|nr:hypothetical protein PspLS_09705 [Pyricularia sp. CBS 133598]